MFVKKPFVEAAHDIVVHNNVAVVAVVDVVDVVKIR